MTGRVEDCRRNSPLDRGGDHEALTSALSQYTAGVGCVWARLTERGEHEHGLREELVYTYGLNLDRRDVPRDRRARGICSAIQLRERAVRTLSR